MPCSQMGDSLLFWLSPYSVQDRKACSVLLVLFLFGSLRTIFTFSITHSCSLTLTVQDCRIPGHVGSPLLPSCILPGPDTVVRNACDRSVQLLDFSLSAGWDFLMFNSLIPTRTKVWCDRKGTILTAVRVLDSFALVTESLSLFLPDPHGDSSLW